MRIQLFLFCWLQFRGMKIRWSRYYWSTSFIFRGFVLFESSQVITILIAFPPRSFYTLQNRDPWVSFSNWLCYQRKCLPYEILLAAIFIAFGLTFSFFFCFFVFLFLRFNILDRSSAFNFKSLNNSHFRPQPSTLLLAKSSRLCQTPFRQKKNLLEASY